MGVFSRSFRFTSHVDFVPFFSDKKTRECCGRIGFRSSFDFSLSYFFPLCSSWYYVCVWHVSRLSRLPIVAFSCVSTFVLGVLLRSIGILFLKNIFSLLSRFFAAQTHQERWKEEAQCLLQAPRYILGTSDAAVCEVLSWPCRTVALASFALLQAVPESDSVSSVPFYQFPDFSFKLPDSASFAAIRRLTSCWGYSCITSCYFLSSCYAMSNKSRALSML